MASAFRISKIIRKGIILQGKFDAEELRKFMKKHPKRNILIVDKGAELPEEPLHVKNLGIESVYNRSKRSKLNTKEVSQKLMLMQVNLRDILNDSSYDSSDDFSDDF